MRIFVILLFFLLTLNADETLTQLFNQLKTVEKNEKFKVVNEIKKHIIALKQQERVEAIKLLQEKKRVQEKEAEVEHLHANHNEESHEIQDCRADSEMRGKEFSMKHGDMPKMDTMLKNMQNMSGMKNLNTMQNLPLTQEERRANRQNMREDMGGRR